MGNLNRKEVLGFISLAIIVLAILGAGFIAKDCGGPGESSGKPTLTRPEVAGGEDVTDDDYNEYSGGGHRKSGSRTKSGRSGKSRKSSSRARSGRDASTKEKDRIVEYDPFSDTIPVDFEDEEIEVEF